MFHNKTMKHVYLLLLLHLMQLSTTANALGNDTDRLSLLKFKESIASDPKRIMSSWNDSIHFCNWVGITCSKRHAGRVTVLNLLGYELRGSISPSIGNLSFLRSIYLSNNRFSGEVPPEIGHLYRLQHLNLSFNMLGGKIPTSFLNCTQLIDIDLTSNTLVGHIPSQLGSLVKLQAFLANSNNLTGGIPSSFGNLSSTSFRFFSVGYNNLAGNIPNDIGRLTSLSFFGAPLNGLSGTFPPSFYNLSSITVISIAGNQIGGNLPPNIGFTLPNLRILAVGGNQFTGPIPVSLTNASGLQMVDLAINNLVGTIPTTLGNLQHISWLNFGQNHFGSNSSSDWRFLTSLTNCTKLAKLSVYSNNFGGVLPDSIGNLSTQLDSLFVGGNYIYGSIPSSIENLVNLYVLHMENNLFTGAIPKSLGKLQKLQQLTLYLNRLSGEIPSSLGNLTQLIRISLFGNKLQGSIPPIIGNYQKLQQLDLSINKLSGRIPVQVFGLPSLSLILNLSNNNLNGSLPVQMGNLNKLYVVDLSANKLSGEIPNSIGDCSNLEFLSLRRNFFNGNITPSLSSIKGLVHLDLSQNNLSGQIPKELHNLPFLAYLNISYNNLEGEVPTGGVFRNASAISLIGNNKLCGGVPNLQLPPCPTKGPTNTGNLRLTIIIICVVLVLILSISCAFALHRRSRRRKSSSSTSTSTSTIEFLSKVSYRALFEATSGFSPNNLIGAGSFGSVYKALIVDDGDEDRNNIVAVKVLNLEKKGASKGFKAECKALRNIRHRNLVKILTACSSVDYNGNEFKALVFEFMENGSLEERLHGNVDQRNILNLLDRLNIIMDVASALDYLHEQCEQPIIHCDVKPSNVLLDKDMVARLSDFGLARLLSKSRGIRETQTSTSTVGLKGSIGYTAPEYGMGGEATKEGDIYSYGILVLEIMTARRPTDEIFKDSFNLRKFVETALAERAVLQIVDPTLVSGANNQLESVMEAQEEPHVNNKTQNLTGPHGHVDSHVIKCLVSVLKIGLACSMESPRDRTRVGDVIKELHFIKNDFVANGQDDVDGPTITNT